MQPPRSPGPEAVGPDPWAIRVSWSPHGPRRGGASAQLAEGLLLGHGLDALVRDRRHDARHREHPAPRAPAGFRVIRALAGRDARPIAIAAPLSPFRRWRRIHARRSRRRGHRHGGPAIGAEFFRAGGGPGMRSPTIA